MRGPVLLLLTVSIAFSLHAPVVATAADREAYLEDFEFIDGIARSQAASVKSKKIDWKKHATRLRPQFASCSSDGEHIKNCMELLAGLRDSHSDITRVNVKDADLPGKFDGLYGAALDFAWDDGKFVLRGVKKGHAQEGSLTPGSALVAVGGEPAWLVFARDRVRIERWRGISSLHSLYSSLSNRLLPFGDAQQLELTFLEPNGKTKKVSVGRWSRDGKAFYASEVELPDGVEHAAGATSAMLKTKWSGDVGYVRVTGSMDQATVVAFHTALDKLEGMKALLLDCRWMGGGGDGPAWEMAGRFYPKGVGNGRNGRIEPSGGWQFDGPVVMLQNESEVSSAETFTWAVSETGRVVSIGRPTGGWGIIPKGFECPSGLLRIRVGVNDRPTPIEGVRTEGIGWGPDVLIPWGPEFCAAQDPVREIGMDVLALMNVGLSASAARDAFRDLFAGKHAAFVKAVSGAASKAKGFDAGKLAKRVEADLRGEIAMELELARLDGPLVPEFVLGADRVARLVDRAKEAGMGKKASALQKLWKGAKSEGAAQASWIELVGDGGELPSDKAVKAYARKHGRSRTGKVVPGLLPRS